MSAMVVLGSIRRIEAGGIAAVAPEPAGDTEARHPGGEHLVGHLLASHLLPRDLTGGPVQGHDRKVMQSEGARTATWPTATVRTVGRRRRGGLRRGYRHWLANGHGGQQEHAVAPDDRRRGGRYCFTNLWSAGLTVSATQMSPFGATVM